MWIITETHTEGCKYKIINVMIVDVALLHL